MLTFALAQLAPLVLGPLLLPLLPLALLAIWLHTIGMPL